MQPGLPNGRRKGNGTEMKTEPRARASRGRRGGVYDGPPLETPGQVLLALAIAGKGLQVGTDLIPPGERTRAAWVIPRALIARGDVSHAALLIYSVLYSLRTTVTADGQRAPDPFMSQKRLAVETGLDLRTVRRETRALEAAGYLKICKSHSIDRTLYGAKWKTFHRYQMLPLEGVSFEWRSESPIEGGAPRPVRKRLAAPLLFVPRWLAVRCELKPTAKLIYALVTLHAGTGSTRRDWAALNPAKIAGQAGMRGQKRTGDGPVFDDAARALEAVRRNIRTLKAHGLLVRGQNARVVAFPEHIWKREYLTETLPAELAAREERARVRAVESPPRNMQNLPLGCARYVLLVTNTYQEGSEGQRGVTYTVEALKTLGEARRARRALDRARRATAREADPLRVELRALVDGAIGAGSAGGLTTDQARAVRDAVTDQALRYAQARGAEGRALVAAARYAQNYLDRALAADAVRGARGAP